MVAPARGRDAAVEYLKAKLVHLQQGVETLPSEHVVVASGTTPITARSVCSTSERPGDDFLQGAPQAGSVVPTWTRYLARKPASAGGAYSARTVLSGQAEGMTSSQLTARFLREVQSARELPMPPDSGRSLGKALSSRKESSRTSQQLRPEVISPAAPTQAARSSGRPTGQARADPRWKQPPNRVAAAQSPDRRRSLSPGPVQPSLASGFAVPAAPFSRSPSPVRSQTHAVGAAVPHAQRRFGTQLPVTTGGVVDGLAATPVWSSSPMGASVPYSAAHIPLWESGRSPSPAPVQTMSARCRPLLSGRSLSPPRPRPPVAMASPASQQDTPVLRSGRLFVSAGRQGAVSLSPMPPRRWVAEPVRFAATMLGPPTPSAGSRAGGASPSPSVAGCRPLSRTASCEARFFPVASGGPVHMASSPAAVTRMYSNGSLGALPVQEVICIGSSHVVVGGQLHSKVPLSRSASATAVMHSDTLDPRRASVAVAVAGTPGAALQSSVAQVPVRMVSAPQQRLSLSPLRAPSRVVVQNFEESADFMGLPSTNATVTPNSSSRGHVAGDQAAAATVPAAAQPALGRDSEMFCSTTPARRPPVPIPPGSSVEAVAAAVHSARTRVQLSFSARGVMSAAACEPDEAAEAAEAEHLKADQQEDRVASKASAVPCSAPDSTFKLAAMSTAMPWSPSPIPTSLPADADVAGRSLPAPVVLLQDEQGEGEPLLAPQPSATLEADDGVPHRGEGDVSEAGPAPVGVPCSFGPAVDREPVPASTANAVRAALAAIEELQALRRPQRHSGVLVQPLSEEAC
eukprot:TRINITY_DN37902_c0_g1_i1.p1 TRINITY_DN37902_c0_g1~~TRINITY_DN37902_c0_g1_i1.p1  ORF type:complete len:801 (+),score=130.71 TRINITY_DN37902_c0_g1_i1:121-2523(+)